MTPTPLPHWLRVGAFHAQLRAMLQGAGITTVCSVDLLNYIWVSLTREEEVSLKNAHEDKAPLARALDDQARLNVRIALQNRDAGNADVYAAAVRQSLGRVRS